MKVLNFTAVEILPALLNRKKVQTIRSVQKYKCFWCDQTFTSVEKHQKTHPNLNVRSYNFFQKPRFKVGEKVQLMWNQRSSTTGSIFCKWCGTIFPNTSTRYDPKTDCGKCMRGQSFPKILGVGEITDVFKLSMFHNPDAEGDTWDIGADEFVAAAAGPKKGATMVVGKLEYEPDELFQSNRRAEQWQATNTILDLSFL